MKIIRVVTRMNIGGPSLHVALLANHLDPARFRTSLVVGKTDPGEGDRLSWVESGPARIVRVASLRRAIHPWRDLRAFFQIARIVWRERPELIHTHMAKAGALGRLAGMLYNRCGPGRRRGQRVLLVHTFHGHVLEAYFPGWLTAAFTAMERWLAKRTHCLVAVSSRTRTELFAKGIGKESQWRVIPLGLDCSELKNLPLPNGSGPLRCGLVGRLVPVKNPSLLLSALDRIGRRHADSPVRAQVVGDGPLRRELEQVSRRLGLERIVSFTGWQEDRRACYESLDVVCVTSHNEGTPVSLIEAMAAGRAVVATAVGGIGDLLGRGQESKIEPGSFHVAPRGLLVRPNDEEGLAVALEALVQDPALRRRIAEAGRAYALKELSHTRLLRDMTELYEGLNRDQWAG